MILNILTMLFLVSGLVLILIMISERRRDILHGPYVTKERDADFDNERAQGKGNESSTKPVDAQGRRATSTDN
jgi:hypothetical protein